MQKPGPTCTKKLVCAHQSISGVLMHLASNAHACKWAHTWPVRHYVVCILPTIAGKVQFELFKSLTLSAYVNTLAQNYPPWQEAQGLHGSVQTDKWEWASFAAACFWWMLLIKGHITSLFHFSELIRLLPRLLKGGKSVCVCEGCREYSGLAATAVESEDLDSTK